MELALANQKGLLTYYLVDGDVKWLKSLGEYRQVFYQIIEQATEPGAYSEAAAVP